ADVGPRQPAGPVDKAELVGRGADEGAEQDRHEDGGGDEDPVGLHDPAVPAGPGEHLAEAAALLWPGRLLTLWPPRVEPPLADGNRGGHVLDELRRRPVLGGEVALR